MNFEVEIELEREEDARWIAEVPDPPGVICTERKAMTRPLSRWGRVAAAIYLGLALMAGALAVRRLAASTEMPGLAAWELLVLALPWTLVLETPLGRQAGSLLLATVVLGGVALNAGLVYAIASGLERLRRAA